MVPNVSSFYNSSLKACRSVKGVVRLGQVDNDTLTLHVPKDPLHLGHQQLLALLGHNYNVLVLQFCRKESEHQRNFSQAMGLFVTVCHLF